MQFIRDNLKVAVYMITFNHEQYIAEAVESVIMQKTTFPYKLFIGEDCSTDNTRKICLALKEKYSDKIELYLNEKNLGPKANAQQIYKACLESNAKYIAMLEGDDYWTDRLKLQKQVELLEKTKSDCCNTLWRELRNGDFLKKGNNKKCSEEGYFMLEKGKMEYFHTSTRLVKKEVLADIMVKYPMGSLADTPLQTILNQYYKVVILCSYTSVYRISGEGVWTSTAKKNQHKAHYEIYKLLSEHIPERRYEFLKKKWNFFFLILTENKLLSRVPKIWFEKMARLLVYLERRLDFFNA